MRFIEHFKDGAKRMNALLTVIPSNMELRLNRQLARSARRTREAFARQGIVRVGIVGANVVTALWRHVG
jgi:hypothetical protein